MFPTSLLTEYQRINLSLIFHEHSINKYIFTQFIDYIDGEPGCRSQANLSNHTIYKWHLQGSFFEITGNSRGQKMNF